MIRKLRSLNYMSICSLMLAVGLLAVIVTQHQQAFAGQTGHDLGYANGRADRLNNNQYSDYCDPNNTASNPDLYCAAYKGGYWAGWNAAGALYGNQQNNNNDNSGNGGGGNTEDDGEFVDNDDDDDN